MFGAAPKAIRYRIGSMFAVKGVSLTFLRPGVQGKVSVREGGTSSMHQFVVIGGVCLCANARREPHGAKQSGLMGRGDKRVRYRTSRHTQGCEAGGRLASCSIRSQRLLCTRCISNYQKKGSGDVPVIGFLDSPLRQPICGLNEKAVIDNCLFFGTRVGQCQCE